MDEALQQFLNNIEATQRRDHADRAFITQYQKLAERTVAAEKRALSSETLPPEVPPEATSAPGQTPAGFFYRRPSSPKVGSSPSPAPESPSSLPLRQQLADAQRERTKLETKNSQLQKVQAEFSAVSRELANARKEIKNVERKLKDREDEIRMKQKLAADAQDEMVSLGLQLSVEEEKNRKLAEENEGLIARWMKEMGRRAETMNRELGD